MSKLIGMQVQVFNFRFATLVTPDCSPSFKREVIIDHFLVSGEKERDKPHPDLRGATWKKEGVCAIVELIVGIIGFQNHPNKFFTGMDPGVIENPTPAQTQQVLQLQPPIGAFVDMYTFVNPKNCRCLRCVQLPCIEHLSLGGIGGFPAIGGTKRVLIE